VVSTYDVRVDVEVGVMASQLVSYFDYAIPCYPFDPRGENKRTVYQARFQMIQHPRRSENSLVDNVVRIDEVDPPEVITV
jgi:hypothetical protein